ncbi:MAG TPA: DUF456 domain-containing protein [Pirellulales bacterium]|nr:DUF456 domain-containing protein [Pirellulales bacterium]
MVTALEITLYVVALFAGLALTILNLPGNWLIVGASLLYAWLMRDDARWDLSMTLVAVLAGLAIVGELVETLAAAQGAKQLGGSRRAALLAIAGSIVGAIVGTGMVPVPVVGTLAGACVGAALGALGGELWKGRPLAHSWRVGAAAFRGRLVGWTVKSVIAAAMVVIALAGVALASGG